MCPVTRSAVRIRVSPAGVVAIEPGAPAVSLLAPAGEFDDDVQDRFCHSVLLFADIEVAADWAADHPGTLAVGLEEASAVGRAIAAAMTAEQPGEPGRRAQPQ